MRFFTTRYSWHPMLLILWLLAAAIWYASWHWEPTRALWNVLDNHLFFILNQRVAQDNFETAFWAIANNRLADLVPAICMVLLFLLVALKDHQRPTSLQLARFLFLIFYITTVMLIFKQVLDINRISPSLTLEPRYLLSELAPWANAKDSSSTSFPGDHGAVLLLWTFFITYYGGLRFGIASLCITLLFALPRLVGGAHWATDLIIGSLTIATIGFSIARFSPLETFATRHLEPLTQRGWDHLIKLFNK